MSLIKHAQQQKDAIELIIEACEQHKVPMSLLESLDGVLHSYIQKINGGQMRRFSYSDVSALANIFAIASLIGVTDASGLDTTSANGIINLYKSARPGNSDHTADEIQRVVDELPQHFQSKFHNLANAWGKSLSQTVQNPTPESMKAVSNRLLKAITLMTNAINRMEQQHREGITKSAVQSNSWRQSGVLNRR